ncbi:MAG: DNA translocase FtsK [Candidatus Gracilibacteria bacterium]|nr:DNA translocase FtsK [Candidatus Gracilibacteria bacterium]
MARKKKNQIPTEYKKILFGITLGFFGVMGLLMDNSSVFGIYYLDGLFYLFGEYYKAIFSLVAIAFSVFLFKDKDIHLDLYRLLGLFFYFSSVTTIIGFFNKDYSAFFNLYPALEPLLGSPAVLFTFFVLFILSLVILFRFSPVNFTKTVVKTAGNIKNNIKSDTSKIKSEFKDVRKNIKENKIDRKKREYDDMLEELQREKAALAKAKQPKQLAISDAPKKIQVEKKTGLGSLFSKDTTNKQLETKPVTKVISNPDFRDWELPTLDLLSDRGGSIVYDEREIKTKEIEIKEKLLQFRIEVDMQGYQVGPTVIQYRLKPKEGVKLQKIVNLKKDLALALHAKNIRIQAPIPGLGVVGIEVPNNNRQSVGLKEIFSSEKFNSRSVEIPLALGKDVSGDIMVGDLTKMPHLLIAGQTGSGKSVGMNAFLISMLYKFSPRELKFIMIDPKRVELSIYNGIPHLLTPVITNADKALNALKWAVAEMLRRYDLATQAKARSLKEYNKKVKKEDRLPYIIVVIDELADLMMSGNKKEVEGSIARIAQMARAVGMHLIVATQRPSVDVITGLIKANIPSRIAFTVASQVDSRTIIDRAGAEDLLSMGDMLYDPTGSIEPERVQGVFVDTEETESVVNQVKRTIDPDMLSNMQDDTIVNGVSKAAGSIMEGYEGSQEEDPEIIEKAIEVVKQAQKGSTSLIQRKLGLGYARAAKILDILEDLGVVGPSNGSKPREVYVD